MAKRTLENLQKQYNSSAASDDRKGPPMPGPGGRRGGPGGPGGPRGMGGKPKGDTKKVIVRLLSYIGAYKYLLVLAFVFLILSTLAGTAASYLLRPIVNAMVDTARTLDERLASMDDLRLFTIFEALKGGTSIDEIFSITRIDRWFLAKLKKMADFEKALEKDGLLDKYQKKSEQYRMTVK